MRQPSFLSLTLLGSFLLLGASLQAQGYGWRPAHRRALACYEGRGGGLNLTEAQRAQIKDLRDRHQSALHTKAEASVAARQALRAALLKPETEVQTLKGLHQKVADAQFELLLEHRSLRQEIQPLLTEEQKAILETRQSEGPGSRRGRRAGGSPWGSGHQGS